jgi:hypothetical protein
MQWQKLHMMKIFSFRLRNSDYQIEVTYSRTEYDIVLMVHIPHIKTISLLKIYRYLPFPFPIQFKTKIHLWGLVRPGQLGSPTDTRRPIYYRHSWSHHHPQQAKIPSPYSNESCKVRATKSNMPMWQPTFSATWFNWHFSMIIIFENEKWSETTPQNWTKTGSRNGVPAKRHLTSCVLPQM